MGAIASLSDLINRLTGGASGAPEQIFFLSDQSGAATTTAAGVPMSFWTFAGMPSGGSAPGAVSAPTNATAGAWKQTDPTGGQQKWLLNAGFLTQTTGYLMIYDRLLHISGLSGTVTTAQTVGGSLTRYTNGAFNFAWAEIYTAVGNTGTTISMKYTNGAGTPNQVGDKATFGGTAFGAKAGEAIMLPLAPGDTGIQAVASVTVTATTGTAGNFGVTVGHLLQIVPMNAEGNPVEMCWTSFPSIPEIKTGACLTALYMPNAASTPTIAGFIQTVCA